MSNPFNSLSNFRSQFNQGLHDLLDKQQLGTFILCLANATNDPELYKQLKTRLENQFQQLLGQYQQAFSEGLSIDVAEEDLLVFLKLHALGFENIKLTQLRKESLWQCQFNQLRSFRPRRMTKFTHQGEISIPFVESHFHFNKPFMAKECFWSGGHSVMQHAMNKNMQLDIFYNKYPFADLHSLIVPQRERCLPQLLLLDMHDTMWALLEQLAENLPGIGLGYNSYGAYASVNHLHFQMFIEPAGLPVSHLCWQHNGGKESYPLALSKFLNSSDAWRYIEYLHSIKQPYNLLYMPGEIYIFPRKVQGSVNVPSWSSGFTWYELSGGMLMFNQKTYKTVTADDIRAHLNELSLDI